MNWVTDATGSGAHEVAACEALPCLQLEMPGRSPDGSSLALVRYDVAPDGHTWGASAIEILDLTTGARRSIAETADGLDRSRTHAGPRMDARSSPRPEYRMEPRIDGPPSPSGTPWRGRHSYLDR